MHMNIALTTTKNKKIFKGEIKIKWNFKWKILRETILENKNADFNANWISHESKL